MRKARYAGWVVKVALFYCSVAGICQSVRAQSETRFRLVHNTIIVVSLMGNEQGPFDFVLDTGTDTTVVDPSLASRLSLAALDRIQMNTLSGTQMLTRSSLRTLAAGSARAENVEVLVQDLGALRQFDSHIQGIAGQNFLSHLNYVLDYRRKSLRFEAENEIRDAVEGERVPMEVRENKMMVASEAQAEGRAKLLLLLDSGSNSVILMRKVSSGVSASSQAWLATASGQQSGMQVGRVRALTIGTQQLHDLAVGVAEAGPQDDGRAEDGLLPTALFQSLYVNNREGFVVFNPRMKKN